VFVFLTDPILQLQVPNYKKDVGKRPVSDQFIFGYDFMHVIKLLIEPWQA
jgi:hypothetical protein